MKMVAQIKFGSAKHNIVSFGNFRYLVYLLSQKEDPDAMGEFVSLMSKELTVPPSRFHYKGKEGDAYVFEGDILSHTKVWSFLSPT